MTIVEVNRGFTKIKAKIRELELNAIKQNNLGITEKEWNYLVWLVESRDKTITELAGILGIGKGTLSNNLKALMKKGLLVKEPAEDKRFINLTPTVKGKKYIELHKEEHQKIKKALLQILSVKEYESLVLIGRKLEREL